MKIINIKEIVVFTYKKVFKRNTLNIIPYVLSIGIGLAIYYISLKFDDDFKGLLINLSASFLSIPLIYLSYQLSSNVVHKNLSRKIFDYAKVIVDTEILSIVSYLQKLTMPYSEIDRTLKGINNYLQYTKDDIFKTIKDNEFLGFQIYKHLDVNRKNIKLILENSFISSKLNDEQIISLIDILKRIDKFFFWKRVNDLFKKVKKENSDIYYVMKGIDLNPRNDIFPERLLLLKTIQKGKHVVQDFGDFATPTVNMLLDYYVFNSAYLDEYSTDVFGLLISLNKWISLTGGELIIDPKEFQFSGTALPIKKEID